jgi:hypothetical protein
MNFDLFLQPLHVLAVALIFVAEIRAFSLPVRFCDTPQLLIFAALH